MVDCAKTNTEKVGRATCRGFAPAGNEINGVPGIVTGDAMKSAVPDAEMLVEGAVWSYAGLIMVKATVYIWPAWTLASLQINTVNVLLPPFQAALQKTPGDVAGYASAKIPSGDEAPINP
jgi:hypothetical protein